MSKPGNLREVMPDVAAFIDELRDAFGADQINPAIKAGLDGQPAFWACENGVEVGAKDTRQGLSVADMVIGPLSATAGPLGGQKRGRAC